MAQLKLPFGEDKPEANNLEVDNEEVQVEKETEVKKEKKHFYCPGCMRSFSEVLADHYDGKCSGCGAKLKER